MPQYTINPGDARAYTCALLEMVDNGELDKDQLIQDLLGWMDESSVKAFCQKNLRDEDNDCLIGPDDAEDDDDDFDYPEHPEEDLEYDR